MELLPEIEWKKSEKCVLWRLNLVHRMVEVSLTMLKFRVLERTLSPGITLSPARALAYTCLRGCSVSFALFDFSFILNRKKFQFILAFSSIYPFGWWFSRSPVIALKIRLKVFFSLFSKFFYFFKISNSINVYLLVLTSDRSKQKMVNWLTCVVR